MKIAVTVIIFGLALLLAAPLLAAAVAGSQLMAAVTIPPENSPTGAAGTAGPTAPSAVGGLSPQMLALYASAAATCPGLSWTLLAAIGTVESGNGTSTLPGVHSGANPAGAEGPMQFEPATFAAYAWPPPPGGADPPTPYDPTDAVYAAARYLCASGARNDVDLRAAIYAYNHDDSYVAEVLSYAAAYATGAVATTPAPAVDPGAVALAWALAQLGTPYVWGGETAGVGFDCSGLVQAAYAAAGVRLPRVAQDQFDAGPHLVAGALLEPGDLVFFGAGPDDITHVGLYLGAASGQTLMVDAPHTGAEVRIEPFPSTVGSPWGDEIYVGATRPDTFS
jgi:cell wall-associated NlpC family hydrolase